MIKTDITLGLSYTEGDIIAAVCERLPVSLDEIKDVRLLRRSLDVKNKKMPHYKATVGFSVSPERERGLLKMKKKVSECEDFSISVPKSLIKSRPVVVGAGPAGLFCALIFAESGAHPIIIERGPSVEERAKIVSEFYKTGKLDPECNIQYGEGGAGAFSDGKLKYGKMDKNKYKVLSEFVAAGADESIMYSDSAHLGTDRLGGIIRSLREKIISLGGEFIFSARLTDIIMENGIVTGAVYEKCTEEVQISTDTLILATGHSAEDVFRLLMKKGAALTPRPFGVGVRVEHPREYINTLRYGEGYDKRLPTASYHLVTHLPSGRSVYSFCMCPGGTVVAAASNKGGVVTNGMSEYARDAENSNAALLVSVRAEDFDGKDPLSGIRFQREIEERAFLLAGGGFNAPCMRMDDFMRGRVTSSAGEEKTVSPSYPRGTLSVDFDEIFPKFITDSLREGIADFERWMPGFYLPLALLTAPETRSTSPIRVERCENFTARGIIGLYPIGEGAGYSGGIVSAAEDGVKCALSVLGEDQAEK